MMMEMTMSSTKVFDPAMHASSDGPAVKAFEALLKGTRYSMQAHPQYFEINPKFNNIYKDRGVDALILRDGMPYGYAELERKLNWTRETYPYPTIHFLQRKAHYADDGLYAKRFFNGLPCHWILFSSDFSHHLVMKVNDAVTHPLIKLDTREDTKNEPFHNVPIIMASFDKLKRLKKIV